MKKLLLLIILPFSYYLINAQPIHYCVSEKGIKIVLKGNTELRCSLSPSFNLNDCFYIDPFFIKDSLNIPYFKINIYQNIIDASDDTWKGKRHYLNDSIYTVKRRDIDKMTIYIGSFDKKKPANFYLEISEFKKGVFFIDIAKINYDRKKFIKYNIGSYSFPTLNITPKKWSQIKKWGD